MMCLIIRNSLPPSEKNTLSFWILTGRLIKGNLVKNIRKFTTVSLIFNLGFVHDKDRVTTW